MNENEWRKKNIQFKSRRRRHIKWRGIEWWKKKEEQYKRQKSRRFFLLFFYSFCSKIFFCFSLNTTLTVKLLICTFAMRFSLHVYIWLRYKRTTQCKWFYALSGVFPFTFNFLSLFFVEITTKCEENKKKQLRMVGSRAFRLFQSALLPQGRMHTFIYILTYDERTRFFI